MIVIILVVVGLVSTSLLLLGGRVSIDITITTSTTSSTTNQMNDGLNNAISLIRLYIAHHAEVQIAQLPLRGGQQVTYIHTNIHTYIHTYIQST